MANRLHAGVDKQTTLIAVLALILVTILCVAMTIWYFCARAAGVRQPFKWIDYNATNLDSGPRNLPDSPDELEMDERPGSIEETTETLDGDTDADSNNFADVTPEAALEGENAPQQDNQNSMYDFDSKHKVAMQSANEFYDYEMNIDDGEEVQSEAE